MNSATSTERAVQDAGETGFRPWHVYLLLSMMAATAAVILSRQTTPAALVLLSATILAAGAVGFALHRALLGFAGRPDAVVAAPLGDAARETLERDKALALRAIKELEFDHAMGKVGQADFQDLRGRLRARAMLLMKDLERGDRNTVAAVAEPVARPAAVCPDCRTANDDDARFCKGCGRPRAVHGA